MKYWQRIEDRMATQGIETITHKATIEDGQRDNDFYIKIGWWRGRPVSIDVTMARHGEKMNNDTLDIHKSALPLVVDLRQRILENTRASLELICREASLLLSSRRCKLDDLAELWRVTQMEPKGHCKQVEDELGDRVNGPLDAAAKLFKLKEAQWEKDMAYNYSEDEIEGMIRDCQEALEERPDDFTGWERSFIEDIEDNNETTHLSEGQIEKLEQIWEERNCG